MDFDLSEEQRSLVALARDFCKREINWKYFDKLEMKESPRERLPWDLLKKSHAIGLTTLAVPKKYGGGGADLLTLLAVAEALGRWGPLGNSLTGFWKWCTDLAACGSQELQDEIFQQLMENDTLQVAISITEADAASDTFLPYDEPGAGMRTFAYRDGDEYIINGEKHFCSGGAQADLLLVYARTDREAPISKGMSLFVVPANTPGVSVTRINDLILNRTVVNSDLLYENVRIPARYLVGEENRGFQYYQSCNAHSIFRLGSWLGSAQRIYEATKDYAKTRIQGGKPIFEHLNVGPRVVDMDLRIKALSCLIYKTAWEYDQQSETTPVNMNPMGFYMCNALVKETSLKLCEHAAEIWGGLAVMKEMPVEKYIRGAYLGLHGLGTRDMNLIKSMKFI